MLISKRRVGDVGRRPTPSLTTRVPEFEQCLGGLRFYVHHAPRQRAGLRAPGRFTSARTSITVAGAWRAAHEVIDCAWGKRTDHRAVVTAA